MFRSCLTISTISSSSINTELKANVNVYVVKNFKTYQAHEPLTELSAVNKRIFNKYNTEAVQKDFMKSNCSLNSLEKLTLYFGELLSLQDFQQFLAC